MATNQMRREAAKRKLERQQERRVAQAKRRQRVAIITSVSVVVVVLVGVVALSMLPGDEPAPPPAPAALGDCAFVPTPDEPAAREVAVPTVTKAPTEGTVAATLTTDRGPIPLTLDRTTGPCAVENFVALASAGFWDGTPCHRLVTSESLKVLQCGDPTGSGGGGPGYTFNDEPPTHLAPSPNGASIYPRGTVAMAKTQAPDSAGSQFFLVYADSELPPDYTVFGTIGEPGLATLEAVAAGGTDGASGSPSDGGPLIPVNIQTASVS